MNICIDIDNTICTQERDYTKAKPFKERIKKINRLYDEGNHITYHTARGTKSGIDWKNITTGQLYRWGCKYHSLIMGKPEADVFVDDRGCNSKDFFKDLK